LYCKFNLKGANKVVVVGFVNSSKSHSLTHAPAGMWGGDKGTPLLSVLGQRLNNTPGMVEGLELPFYSSTPGILGSSPFPFSLWCPVKGCAGGVAWCSPRHMSNPSPSPSHDDGAHAVLVAVGEKMLVGDGLGPEYS